jgi:phage terminase large subunit
VGGLESAVKLHGSGGPVTEDDELYAALVAKCAVDRYFFVTELLGVEKVEDWQRETMAALDSGETRISIRSGNGVGKTALCAWLSIHYLLFRDDVKIPVTAPSSSQLKDGLIPETKRWISRLPEFLRVQIEMTEDRIRRTPGGDNNFISFRTARADSPEALAGIHASHVMAIVDEASGVPDIVFEFAEGTMSSAGSIFILIGNPTRPTGYFHKTHTILKHKWFTKKVSSFDSSRVTQDFVDNIALTYGTGSNTYRYKVLGEFPESVADTVIPKELIDGAYGRDVEVLRGGVRIWGVDPGRGGDPTGFCVRNENVVEELVEWYDADLMRVTGRVKERWDRTPDKERPESIYVDSIGLGAGVADRLRELGLPAVDVNVAESPSMKDRFTRLRAELWYGVRDWLEQRNVAFPKDLALAEKLMAELAEPQATFTSTGKADVESKSAMKQRGVRSPNLADALCLTFGGGGAIAVGRSNGRSSWKKPLNWIAPSIY